MLAPLPAISPRRLGHVAPRFCLDASKTVAHACALGLGIEARGADRFPAIEHDSSPGFLGLNLEAHDIAPPALVTDGCDHAPDLGAQSAGVQRGVAALLNHRSAAP